MTRLPLLATIALIAACTRNTPAPTTTSSVASQDPVPDLKVDVDRVNDIANPDVAPQNATTFLDPGAADPQPVREAVAILAPTSGNRASGIVRFRRSGAGLDVFATVDGLPAGEHAYHVHVFGDCSASDATSAGPHFHFTGSSFDPEVEIITGNLGELSSDGAGTATHHARHPAATLDGKFSIIGRSVVVHAKPNDPSAPPGGDAGARIACGVIGIGGNQPPRTASP
ncbi:MAG: superoxide dismutase family protein [Kofleriaceae bacterium]